MAGLIAAKRTQALQTVSGIVIDATMNNIVLHTNDGDTINISRMDTNPKKVPAVLIGDSVKATYTNEKLNNIMIPRITELIIISHSPYYYK